MSEINFNSIYDGVSLALHAAFPAVRVHSGSVKQGISPGDFNVVMPGAEHLREVGHRYRRTPKVDVIYYPKKQPYTAECYDVANQLTLILGSITTPQGDIIHATSCKWALEDDVMHLLVEYDHFGRIPQEQVLMETLKIEQEG